ncbi:hypothetical protein FDT66_11280 [Polaribacter aestuariivivens]|uniref:Uncharacterized protein n=1 Tax=Polaribacter aestuariivivens TaxID=2304626 RepID=A0A5S3N3K7_9FLAO|nr:hypothetical protein [Polaribacter aestuariivivens]TMM29687.1 hypothetical protein FDT66_11280 [Polaribacter aestuariivivens]
MKKRNRIIFIIGITLIYTSIVLFFFPKESEFYLKSDIKEFSNSLIPISAIFSFVIVFLAFFDKKDFTGNKITKIVQISFIGIMSYFLFQQNSKIVTTVGLYINRLSEKDFLTREFIVNFKRENEPYILGRITNRKYESELDKVKLKQTEFNKIMEKETIKLKFKKGIFGIPFEPIKTN